MRGKRVACRQYSRERGITPAGAGKTEDVWEFLHHYGDHPRRCGENLRAESTALIALGSPPQVRGKLSKITNLRAQRRITPAGAGKTLPFCNISFSLKDHPRRCGENVNRVHCLVRLKGSPPQVRGKQIEHISLSVHWRITPAGAGKTPMFQASLPAKQDHPRRCGENNFAYAHICGCHGSPPQVRGKLGALPQIIQAIGITPAGAGKTSGSPFVHKQVRDHPRRCGENLTATRPTRLMSGSPPQVRGKH